MFWQVIPYALRMRSEVMVLVNDTFYGFTAGYLSTLTNCSWLTREIYHSHRNIILLGDHNIRWKLGSQRWAYCSPRFAKWIIHDPRRYEGFTVGRNQCVFHSC